MMLSGMLAEVDKTPWFLKPNKLEEYIQKVTKFADYNMSAYVDEIRAHFPDSEIIHKLKYYDVVKQKNVINAKCGPNSYNPSITSIKQFKKLVSKNDKIPYDVEFHLPKSDDDIQLAKKIMIMSYSAMEPINRKLKWAVSKDMDGLYITTKFNALVNKNGFNIKLKCMIDNVPETKTVAIQVHDIISNSDVDYQVSKQFVDYIKSDTKLQFSKKSFVFYIKDFDTLNNLFFLFNRKDISIDSIDFYYSSDIMDFSDYVKDFCEL